MCVLLHPPLANKHSHHHYYSAYITAIVSSPSGNLSRLRTAKHTIPSWPTRNAEAKKMNHSQRRYNAARNAKAAKEWKVEWTTVN
jgi:hypothetical protein